MRGGGDWARGMRGVAICAVFGLTTIRLDAQRIDALVVGASRVPTTVVDSIAASDTVAQLTTGTDAATLLRATPIALLAGAKSRHPDDGRRCGSVVPLIALATLGALVAGSLSLMIADFDGDGLAGWRKIVVPVAVLSVAAVGVTALICNR